MMKTLKTYRQLFEKNNSYGWDDFSDLISNINDFYGKNQIILGIIEFKKMLNTIDVNTFDNTKGYNLIYLTISKANYKLSEILVKDYNIKLNLKTRYGNILTYASKKADTRNKEFLGLLIEYGANWNIQDENGYDFVYYVNSVDPKLYEYLVKEYPDKYQDYLDEKNMGKFDI